MKPLRIEFSAFGSFPGEVSIDFSALASRGLFVVTGDTGTGKTTIFDAMSYALFGEMPSKDGRDIRSHHADPAARTKVRFTFELDGQVYYAEREPEQERPKARGAGTTKESAKGMFVREEPGGSTNTLASGVRSMDRVVPEVVGLDAAQFRRVMLLPQGEVARFLLDDSGNREALLGALFGGDIYTRIGEELEAEYRTLDEQVRKSEEEVRRHTMNATERLRTLHGLLDIELPDDLTRNEAGPPLLDRDRLGELATSLDAPYDTLRDEATARRIDADKAVSDAKDARVVIQQMREAADTRSKLDALAEGEPDVVAAAEEAEASRTARPVVAAAERVREAEASSRRATNALAELKREIDQLGIDHALTVPSDTPARAREYLSGVKETNDEATRQLEDLESALSKVRAISSDIEVAENARAEAEAERSAAENRLQAIREEVAQLATEGLDTAALDTEHETLVVVQDLIRTRDGLVEEESTRREAASTAANEYEAIFGQFIKTEAPRLAAQLRAGEPCAVCGSVDHPAPAVADGLDPVAFAMVERARARWVQADTKLREVKEKLQDTRGRLGQHADAQVVEIDESIFANRAQRDRALAANARRRALEVEEEREAEKQRAAERLVTSLDGELSTLARELGPAETAAEDAEAKAATIDREALDRRRRGIERLRPLVDRFDESNRSVEVADAELRAAQRVSAEALQNAGLPDVDTARTALLDELKEQAALDALKALETDRSRLEGRLEALIKDGLPEVAPDLEALTDAVNQARKIADEITDRRSQADAAIDALNRNLEDIDEVGDGTGDLQRRASLTKQAQIVCRGLVPPRVSLRRWVLGRELERVVDAASQHLSMMTSGRYALRRVTEPGGGNSAKGLDLEVHDAHTGRARRPNSLSGGEQFQASLALALGLADVVSRGGAGSGRKIEALFVDEGFGSLDPRALDDAIETLHQLRATGRMVGAITHVEAMKERLHAGIVVTRLPDGRGSTLTVNP